MPMIILPLDKIYWGGWQIFAKIGNRHFLVNNSDHQQGVMKLYSSSDKRAVERYHRDLYYTEILSKEGIAPPLYFTNTCDGKGIVVISKRYDHSLQDLIESDDGITSDLKQKLIPLIDDKVRGMHSLNIAHGDLHCGNILVNLDPLDVAIIDFEYSFDIDKGEDDPVVQEWMRVAFDWEAGYDAFVGYDFENWKMQLN